MHGSTWARGALLALAAIGCTTTTEPEDAFGNTPAFQVLDYGPRSTLLKEWRMNPFVGTPFEQAWERKHPKPNQFVAEDHFEKHLEWILTHSYGFPIPNGQGSGYDLDEAGRVAGAALVLSSAPGEDAESHFVPALLHDGETYTMTSPGPGAAWGLNEHLQAVGSYETDDGSVQGFRWNGKFSTFQPLPVVAGTSRVPAAINDDGVIVGTATTAAGQHAFVLEDGQYTQLPQAGAFASGRDVNASGVVVGTEQAGFFPVAVQWKNGDKSYLEGVQKANGAFVWSHANAINDTGTAVGQMLSNGKLRPTLWKTLIGVEHHGPDDLTVGAFVDVNKGGAAVGSITKGNTTYATQWPFYEDLNDHIPQDQGWHLEEATAINDKGWIVGNGTRNGNPRVFLLLPWGTPLYEIVIGDAVIPLPGTP